MGPMPAPTLHHRFADRFPELALPWQAQETDGPELVLLNAGLAEELGLDADWLASDDGLRLLTGERPGPEAKPVAQAYAGHQFGHYSPRLGDGRALLLGELVPPRRTRDANDAPQALPTWRELHLKGSGRTPFARGDADGQAVLGPMLREYAVSEAMHALGVPTTRALAVVATGRPVRRAGWQPGALLARTAASHLRVGSFQYAAALPERADPVAVLRRLVDEAILRHHPHAAEAENPALALYEAVIAAQAELVARWMLVGFVHGVMNTDNMTLSGETIDYGPCAFIDAFEPAASFSSIDTQGRYAFGNQGPVAAWNLARLGEALVPVLDDDAGRAVDLAQEALGGFQATHLAAWRGGLRAKLGLSEEVTDADVAALTDRLFPVLAAARTDWTGFWERLAEHVPGGEGGGARGEGGAGRGAGRSAGAGEPTAAALAEAQMLVPGAADPAAVAAWLRDWQSLGPDAARMRAANPVYIPRNHLLDEALTAAEDGDLGPVHRLLEAVTDPFTPRPGLERYAEPGPSDAAPFVTYCGT